jgi:hypothetical protein
VKDAKAKKPHSKPLILTHRMEGVLKAVYFYRHMTALDIAHYLHTPKTLGYIRNILADLSGGGDFQTHSYLYRFPMPKAGNHERVYTLGSHGPEFLQSHLGMPVDWYFRPDKVRHLSEGHISHSLLLTRFLVAGRNWSERHPDFRLARVRISYEFQNSSVVVELPVGSRKERVSVVPDGWMLFEHLQEGRHTGWLPVLLEIDRATEFQVRFKQHNRSRLEFIRSGGYERLFGERAVMIAYATSGGRAEYRETRRQTMSRWIREVLEELRLTSWAPIFRVASLTYEELYTSPLFEGPVWFRPDSDVPLRLLDA